MTYLVHQGRVHTWSLEVHVADHCNLRCAQCCTLSPHLPEQFLTPEVLDRDLRRLSAVLRPNVLKLTGGEPLLHPELLTLVQTARQTGISDMLSMTTNGHLLGKAPDRLLEALDRITLSWYQSAPLSSRALDRIEDRCKAWNVGLTIKARDTFQTLTPWPLEAERTDIQQIHADCWMKVRCHLVRNGVFYTCTRPPHLQTWLAKQGRTENLAAEDGLVLDGAELGRRLHDYLTGEEALRSCQFCLGGSGEWGAHKQLEKGAGLAP